MLKHLLLCAALTSPALAGGIIDLQSEYGTPEEAQAMLTRAIGAVKADKNRRHQPLQPQRPFLPRSGPIRFLLQQP